MRVSATCTAAALLLGAATAFTPPTLSRSRWAAGAPATTLPPKPFSVRGSALRMSTAEADAPAAEGETFEFQAEVSRVMDIIINSLYQVRISRASAAEPSARAVQPPGSSTAAVLKVQPAIADDQACQACTHRPPPPHAWFAGLTPPSPPLSGQRRIPARARLERR